MMGTNLEAADCTGVDLSDSWLLGVNVIGTDFSGANTRGAMAAGVQWSNAKVPPAEIPAAPTPPPWLVGALVAAAALVLIYLFSRRRQA
jgi:hypothetical protein